MPETNTTDALTTIVKALTPLNSEERHRTVDAAMLFLGETAKAAPPVHVAADAGKGHEDGGYPPAVIGWMKQYDVSGEELDQVFHFNGDGSFAIHDVPGKSKREKTLHTYVLAGVGRYLTTNERAFDDKLARGFCETIGCYDPANHAAFLRDKGPEFSGDKNKGYSVTNVGVKRAATLIKELAGAAK
jgi:hypothetical protein